MSLVDPPSNLRLFRGGSPDTPPPEYLAPELFPLPLAPFEAMTYFDSWPDYPMSCGAVFSFDGKVNRTAFDEAVALANRRHPLVEAHVRADGQSGKLHWQPSTKRCEVRWIQDQDATGFAACRPFDLEKETGIRLWVQERNGTTNVHTEFHHSCCDGAGGLAYMEDIFSAYAMAMTSGRMDAGLLPTNDPMKLRDRGKFTRSSQSMTDRYHSFVADMMESGHCLWGDHAKLGLPTQPRDNPRESWDAMRFVTCWFEREHCQRMRMLAAKAGATLNDYLLNAFSVVLQAWNLESSADSQDLTERLRILVPVNLRGRADMALGLTNRMSYAFVSRPQADVSMSEQSLRAVSEQSSLNRRAQLPIRLLEKFALMQKMGLWSLVFSKQRCLATAAFSNLGDPTRRFGTRFPRERGLIKVGNLVMTHFAGTTALRPNTRAGLFLNTYGDRLAISARLDPKFFTRFDAETLLDRFACQIGARPQMVKAA